MENSPGTISKIPWPFHIEDRVTAVHFAIDPDCPWANPVNCPYYNQTVRVLEAYDRWVGYQDSGEN